MNIKITNIKLAIPTIVCLLIFLYPHHNIAAETTALSKVLRITNFSINELNDNSSVELTAQAANCLNNAKIVARVKNKKKGLIKRIFTKNTVIDDIIELQRIYYDPETNDAVFSGIIPYKLKETDIFLEISNYPTADAIARVKEEPAMTVVNAPVKEKIIVPEPEKKPIVIKSQPAEDTELLNRIAEEKKSNEANEELGKSLAYLTQKKQEAAKLQENSDYEVAVGVVVILPLLLEFAAGIGRENDYNVEPVTIAESEPNSDQTESESDTENENNAEADKNKKNNQKDI